jgi:hypothetical protein
MDHYQGKDSSLNEQILWRLRGPCDAVAVAAAVTGLSARHESLRTTFRARGPRLTQVVHDPAPVPLREVDVSSAADMALAARAEIEAELLAPIDASAATLRATLVRRAPQDHTLCLTMHHFVTDDWSNAVLSRDIRALYDAAPGAVLPPVDWQYGDWSRWQQEVLDGDRRRQLTEYWRGKLAGARLPELPTRAAGSAGDAEPAWVAVEYPIDAAVVERLRELARTQRTTLFPVMLSVFYLLLSRATGQRDLTVASLFANRTRPEIRETVGFFVSMVLLRCAVDPDAPFSDLVRLARGTVMDGMRHQDLPYQLLPPDTLTGAGRANDVMFQLLGSFLTRADMEGEELDDLEGQLSQRRFAFEFVLVPRGEALTALLLCSRERFSPDWADRFVRDYVALASEVAG